MALPIAPQLSGAMELEKPHFGTLGGGGQMEILSVWTLKNAFWDFTTLG